MPELAESTLAQSFCDAFGSEPSGVWSAPGRVNLMGEHTDYNAGLCLPIALPQRTYAAVRPRADRHLRLRSLQSAEQYELELDEVGAGNPPGWGAYAAGVLWALQDAGRQVGGLDVLVDGRVPVGAGLSSSAALECAVAAAASDLFDLALLSGDEVRATLAAICVNAENTIAQAPTGGMDQSASLRCQDGHALLLDCRDGTVAQVPFDLSAHGLSLLVMDTRAEHSLVDGQYAQRRRSCEEAARQLGLPSLREVAFDDLDQTLDRLPDNQIRARAKHIVTEIERVRQTVALLRAGAPARRGPTVQRLARVHARRLRDLLRRARPRGRGGNGSRRPGSPDDRRGIRWLGHRAGARRQHGRGDLGRHTSLCGQGFWYPQLLRCHGGRAGPAREQTGHTGALLISGRFRGLIRRPEPA